MPLNTAYFPGDSETNILAKLLILFGGSPTAGDGRPQLLRKLLSEAADASAGLEVPLNFQDSADDADAIVYHTGGTVESFRVVGSTGFIQYNQEHMRLHQGVDTGSITFLGATVKANGSFLEFTGQDNVTNPGFAGITVKEGGSFKILSSPYDSFVSTAKLTLDGTTGLVTLANNLVAQNVAVEHSTLTYAASVALDFSNDGLRTVTLGGDIEFTTSNRSAGRSLTIRIIDDGSGRAFTFPAGWKFVNASGAPASIGISKVGILSVTCFGSADSDIVAAYSEEP